VPEQDLLWFHHVGWDERLRAGDTLWNSLVTHYDAGVAAVSAMDRDWAAMKPYVDDERFTHVASFLAIQKREAKWWRDACIAYFQSISGRPLPAGSPAPDHPLDWYKAQQFTYAPGHH
jgi:alpha-glucuronidase